MMARFANTETVLVLAIEKGGKVMTFQLDPKTVTLECAAEISDVPPEPGDTFRRRSAGAVTMTISGILLKEKT